VLAHCTVPQVCEVIRSDNPTLRTQSHLLSTQAGTRLQVTRVVCSLTSPAQLPGPTHGRSQPTATMKISLLDRISAKIELWRLEQRYTKRRHRRSTFVSDAIYVDGEYVHATSPSSSWAATSPTSALHGEAPAPKRHLSVVDFRTYDVPAASTESVPSTTAADGRDRADDGRKYSLGPKWNATRPTDKRRSMATMREVRWQDSAS